MNLANIEYQDKLRQYVLQMRSVFKPNALFSDETANYVTPMEPDPGDIVTIRFRTWKDNVDKVYLVSNDRHLAMEYEKSEGDFDYFKIRLVMPEESIHYFFEIHAGKIRCFYNKIGVSRDRLDVYDFTIAPGFHTPEWAKGAVMYQIFVDRFSSGDTNNTVEDCEYYYIGDYSRKVTDWRKNPSFMGVREFYGGDLAGVLQKMDYLQDLGVDVIYFNPLFVSPSNHKYDIQDYDNIDPHIGKIVDEQGDLLQPGQMENRYATKYINRVANKKNLDASNELFAQVVEEAHKRGMKVILDGVFNHCGSFNKWMDRERVYENFEGYPKGAYVSADSPYRDYFHFYDPNQWPYNGSYDGWWGHDTLPKLNYEGSRELYDYVLHIGQKWVSPPYNADGWRLDVAADLGHSPEMNHRFWKDFQNAVRQANPNAIVLAEHYGSPKEWIENCEWDTVMNYDAFMEPVTWFLTGMQKHSDDYREDLYGNADSFWGAMIHHSAAMTTPSLQIAMNELSNHDHSRFLTRTNKKVGRVNTMGSEAANQGVNKAVLREAVAIQMTWPGAPTIYYGDEAGVCGFTDPDNRRTYPWGHEDQELIDFHREMIRIHKENRELLTGSIKKAAGDYNFISYARFNKEEQCLIVVNNGYNDVTKDILVWEFGIPRDCKMERLILTSNSGFTVEKETYNVVAGKLTLTLPPTSVMVLKHYKE